MHKYRNVGKDKIFIRIVKEGAWIEITIDITSEGYI